MISAQRVRRSEFFSPMTPGWILGTSLFFVAVLFTFWVNQAQELRSLTLCPFRLLMGLPCPLCGGTTASLKLAVGKADEAFRINPLVTILLVVYPAWSLLWIVFGIRLTSTAKTTVVAALLLLVLAINWVYILLIHPSS